MKRTEVVRLPASPVPSDFLDDADGIVEAVETLVRRHPDFECLTLLDRQRNETRLSLSAFWKRAKQVQACLEANGVTPGDAVVLVLPTGFELLAAYFGAMSAGAVPALAAVPSNRISDPSVYRRTLGAILENAEARVLYCDEAVAALLGGSGRELAPNALVLRPEDVAGGDASPVRVATRPDDLASIQYSSGTTGTPKGVQLSHRAILVYLRALRDGLELRPDDVHVNWAPLYHDMGLFGAFLLPLLCGCPSVLIPTMDFLRDPGLWLWALHRYRGTVSWAPNFAYSLCAKRIRDDALEGLDLSSWRHAISASEPLLAHTVEAFRDRFARYGLRREALGGAWGLAEVVMVGTVQPASCGPTLETVDRDRLVREGIAAPVSDAGMRMVSTGRCLPGFAVEVRNDQGEALPDRHVGQLWLRSETLFSGYRGDPERSAGIVRDGWIDTGDRGYLVGEDVFFVSRDKDLVIIGGENYAPHDIEVVIDRVPGVREGCGVAFGVVNEERGTEDLACVVETRLEGADELAALEEAIRREVTATLGLGIRHLKLVPPGGIEKTTSGKLSRSGTHARYADELAEG